MEAISFDAQSNMDAQQPAQEDFDDAKAKLNHVFEIMEIKRVIVVDDDLSTPVDIDAIIGALVVRQQEISTNPDFPAIDFSEPDDIWRPKVAKAWSEMPLDKQDAVARSLNVPGLRESNESSRHTLTKILGAIPLTLLSLTQWKAQQVELLNETDTTLFLFDQDMSKNPEGTQHEGMRIISQLIKAKPSVPLYFGLFSNSVAVNHETEVHLNEVKKWSLQGYEDRFAVISKQGLDSSPASLAFRLKRVAISPRCHALKHKVFGAIESAVDAAKREVENLRIYDFDQIVFRSSFEEGVWEVDTLLRLFGVFFRDFARSNAGKDADVRKAADAVRRVVTYDYVPKDAPSPRASEIQRMEMYEKKEYLLEHRMPIEVGDIFKKSTGNSRFILLEQPCDLMVRGGDEKDKVKGTRNLDFVTLVEVSARGTKESSAPLSFFSREEGVDYFVNFNRFWVVPVCILDLCVCSDDGSAKIKIGKECPEGMIPAWQERYRILQADAKKKMEEFQRLCGAGATEIPRSVKLVLERHFTGAVAGAIEGKIVPNMSTIEFKLEREARLRQPWAGGLLRKFSYHRARDAFDHPFDKSFQRTMN